MAFLFKSKKAQQGTALPPASRNVHTSEGSTSSATPPLSNGPKVEGNAFAQTTTPSSSYNNSLNSATSPTSPDSVRMRQRAESESQVSLPRKFTAAHPAEIRIPDPGCTSGPTAAAGPQWCASAQSKLVPIPMVTTSSQLLHTPNEPLPPLWRRYQFSRFERG
jgi:hypothetical protein